MGLKKLFAARDMTQGAPWQRILEFSIPMLIGNVAQQLYNTADSVIVGMFVGDNALAAVGSAMPILNLLLALFVGIATGAGIVISQAYGARDREGLSKSIGNCISLAAVAALVIMVVGPLLTRPMLELLGTPDSILDWCTSYLKIQLWFVAGFDLGVAGVSLATVIAQSISAVFCFRKLMKMRSIFDLNKKTIKLESNVAMRIIRLGVPSGITQAIFSMAGMVVQTLTNSMGEMVIAANVIIMRVDGFAMMPNFSFGQAMSVYTGQNVGAAKYDRVGLGTKQGTIIAVSCSAAITCVLLFLNKFLFGIFTDTTELIDLAGRMMRLMAVGYVGVAITQSTGGVMRGAGDTVSPMWISIISTVLLRVPVAYILAHFTASEAWPHGHPFSLSASLLISWVLGAVMSCIVFKKGKWKKTMMAYHEP